MNPWFPQWPKDARREAVRVAPPAKRLPMKTLPAFVRDGNYPAHFLQVLPIVTEPIAPNDSVPVVLKFDDDYPFRLDAMQAVAFGATSAETFLEVSVLLPSGRSLTARPVSLSAFSGTQGGKAFVHFRYRFNPGDLVELHIHNTHPTASIRVSGVAVGKKLVGDSRL